MPTEPIPPRRLPTGIMLLLPVLVLGAIYAATLQVHISGSFPETSPENILKNEYIKDVSEIQVALNTWGTIHHTGYPLFAILGNLFTLALRQTGLEPAAAASLYATVWGAVTLGGFGLLVGRLTGRLWLVVLCVILLGTARSIWIHHVVAEVYSMSLALVMLMWLVALWPGSLTIRQRVLWLAFLGGVGVAHHRAVAFIAPGLLLAIGPALREVRRSRLALVMSGVGLALLGFLPYIYLPLRAWQGGNWVYGEPETPRGFWTEFTGREADRLVRLPATLTELAENAAHVWAILGRELSLPGLLVALVGLGLAVTVSPHRRAARVVALSAAGPTLFTLFYHTAVLPQAILMPTVLALVFGIALGLDWLITKRPRLTPSVALALALWAAGLVAWHGGYIRALVTEPTGQQVIARLSSLPRDGQPAIMFPWGPRYAAASYARLVTGEAADVLVVDHKADYQGLLAAGYQLYTEPETFYTYPPPWPSAYGEPSDWWSRRLGSLVLSSAAPGFVRLSTVPDLTPPDAPLGEPIVAGITRQAVWLSCDAERLYLHVIWSANVRPSRSPSIFVHLTGNSPEPNPITADSRHPVYGLYPFTEFSPGQRVRDDFTLPRLPDKTTIRFGLYEQVGEDFINYGEMVLPTGDCAPPGP